MAQGVRKHHPSLALIPPIDLLEYTDETTYQLMLPQLVTFDAYEYTYRTHGKDPGKYVILDNGAAESYIANSHELISLALEYGANELVMPDIIQNRLGSQKLMREFKISWQLRLADHDSLRFIKKMFVIQGTDYNDFVRCAAWASSQDFIDVIGIPRHAIATCGFPGVRARLGRLLEDVTDKPVHLLGASPEYPTELRDEEWGKNIRSTDTSMPFNYAYAGKKIRSGQKVGRPPMYFVEPAESFDPALVDYNVKLMKEWTR